MGKRVWEHRASLVGCARKALSGVNTTRSTLRRLIPQLGHNRKVLSKHRPIPQEFKR